MRASNNYQKRKSRSKSGNMDFYPKRKKRPRLRIVIDVDVRETTDVEVKPVKCDFLTEGLE